MEKSLFAFSQCGDPNLGVVLFKCLSCKVTLGVPFSCKDRICPSCIARKAEQTSIQLVERIPQVDHRHLVISLPKKMGLRQRIQEDRRLFRELARTVNHTIRRHIAANVKAHRNRRADIQKARPGIVVAQHSWGSTLNFHPHFHLCISDGAFTIDGEFYRLWDWKPKELLEALRRAILRTFVRLDKLTPQAADILAGWEPERSGFSLFIGPVIPADDREALARLIGYLCRSPISFRQLTYQETTGLVRLQLKKGGVKEWANPLDFLADLSLHIPRARQQTITYAGHYANSTGNLTIETRAEDGATTKEPRRWIPWSKLIAKAWSVDPEYCWLCGELMVRSRPVIERLELKRLLKSLKIFGYPARPPPIVPGPASTPLIEVRAGPFVADPGFQDEFNQCPPGWDEAG